MSLKRNRILDCFSERESETDQPCNTLKILTWNVDGLCLRFPIERAENAIEEIIKECADVITLQEVTHNTVDVFTTYLESAGYSICGSNHFTFPYFTISFVRAGLSTRAQRSSPASFNFEIPISHHNVPLMVYIQKPLHWSRIVARPRQRYGHDLYRICRYHVSCYQCPS